MMNATESGQLCFGSIKAAVVGCLIENHKSVDSNLGPESWDWKHQRACVVCVISRYTDFMLIYLCFKLLKMNLIYVHLNTFNVAFQFF